MKKENIFYLLFFLTILAVRTGVFLFPQRKIIIGGTIIHHLWIGIILIFLVMLLPKGYAGLRMVLFSIGFGLVADELVFILLGGGTVRDYWSGYSVSGAALLMLLTFALRKKLIKKFKNIFQNQ